MARKNSSYSFLRWISIGFIILAVFLTTVQLVKYSRVRSNFPNGLKIAGVPVGELDYTLASERILAVYLSPVELNYGNNIIQVKPASLGFEPNLESMLAAADKQRVNESFWGGFWKFMLNQSQTSKDIPLQAEIDEDRIKSYLVNEIAPRYDLPATPPMPILGESGFYPGQNGTALDADRAVGQVMTALKSSSNRTINLTYRRTSIPKPPLGLLEIALKEIIDASGFDGIVELYLEDLKNPQTLNFAYNTNEGDLEKDIAFSAWSTIKIPVMVSAFRLLPEPADEEYLTLMQEMIDRSDNTSTDDLAQSVIEPNLAPLIVTGDLNELGLDNTFWGGHFYIGAPLLQGFSTEANQRLDIDTEPDIYAQTTPSDMGKLMEDIYYCAELGGGSLIAAFEGQVSQNECKLMIDYLAANKIGVLIQAGVPAGTIVAHKHGWANESDDGYIHTISDVSLVITPGGDYTLTIFVHHPIQAVFDPVNLLFANLSSAIYNYFNLQSQ